MARRDDGNEPVRVRPPRSVASREQEIAEYGVSPAPIEGQVDIEVPAGAQSPGVVKPVGPIDFSFIPDVCVTGLQPADVTSSIIRLLQGHFGEQSFIRNPELRSLVWANTSESKLLIVSSTYVRQPEANKKPRLVVKRGAQRSGRVVAGDRNSFENVDAHNSKSSYARWISGSANIAIITEAGHLTDILSEEVYLALTFLAPKVVESSAFYDFQVMGLTGVEPVDQVGGEFMAGVALSFIYETAWTTTDITPTLQSLQTNILTIK
jgi:hypothetical protein